MIAFRNRKRSSCIAMFCLLLMLSSLGVSWVHAATAAKQLSLAVAVSIAQKNDPWLIQNSHSQQAMEAMSVAAGTLPDPKVSVALANLPTDTFDFGQEAMTQLNVGVTQMIPRGDSLALRKKQLQQTAEQFPFQREERRARLVVEVAKLWFDGYEAQESIRLIEEDRPLFVQLSEVAEASYSSALGKTRQQDIIRAQLELTRLDDRLTVLQQKREMAMEQLGNWVSDNFSNQYLTGSESRGEAASWGSLRLAEDLPVIRKLMNPGLLHFAQKVEPQELYTSFITHPAVQDIERKITASNTGVDLVRQKYRSEFGVNASYSYRDAAPNGADRADLVSLGISFDLPWFTASRQDKEVTAALAGAEAVKTMKWQLLRKMIADFEKQRAQLNRLNQRSELYQETLLPQLHEQAEASLTAYTNDDGDFAEVVRARIAELNGRLAALKIDVERQKTVVQLNYFFMKSPDEIVAEELRKGEKQ